MIKTCPICGEEFLSNVGSRKYCSERCSRIKINLYRKERYRRLQPIMKKACPFCGKEFEPAYRFQIYCSHECYYKASQLNRALKRRALKRKAQISKEPAQDVFQLSKKQIAQRDRLKEKLLRRRAISDQ